MIATYPHTNNITLLFQDSATIDYSQFEYDMVLTSPPYFNRKGIVEVYEHMPEYATRADFNQRFLFPVVRATFDHLKSGGHYCLNVPQSQYEEVKGLLGEATEKVEYPLQKRTPNCKYQEYIYIWTKP
jgi:tRNA1(Val) A37 N6-methylase TrmN6